MTVGLGKEKSHRVGLLALTVLDNPASTDSERHLAACILALLNLDEDYGCAV